jgi:GT2 family glycosyltransferase
LSNQIDLSVVIASYNTAELTKQCLESVLRNSGDLKVEILLVDDCSTDETVSMVHDHFPSVRLLVNDTNRRYAVTNNRGMAHASGRYFLLLNTDTVILENALVNLVSFMDANKGVNAAGPKLVNPDGSIQHCIRSFPGIDTMIFQSLGLHHLWPNNRITEKYYRTTFDYAKASQVDSIGTTAFILRRSTYETFGGLDERFPLFFCDLAYCISLTERGGNIWYTPDASIVHYGSASINQNSAKEINSLHDSLKLFYDNYRGRNASPVKRQLIHLGIELRRSLKLLENRVSSDKRVHKGPGSPSHKSIRSLQAQQELSQLAHSDR